jgi:hypothetical protein
MKMYIFMHSSVLGASKTSKTSVKNYKKNIIIGVSGNIQCHVNIIISTEYVQYTQVSVKIFGLRKMKGTDNNILNILSLFNFFMPL